MAIAMLSRPGLLGLAAAVLVALCVALLATAPTATLAITADDLPRLPASSGPVLGNKVVMVEALAAAPAPSGAARPATPVALRNGSAVPGNGPRPVAAPRASTNVSAGGPVPATPGARRNASSAAVSGDAASVAAPGAAAAPSGASAVPGNAAPVVAAPAPVGASPLPSLAKACQYLEINGSRNAYYTCQALNITSATFVDACDEVAKLEPVTAAGDALAGAFTTLSNNASSGDGVLTRDINAACALARVFVGHDIACDAPRGSLDEASKTLAAACNASRAALLGNGSFSKRPASPGPAPGAGGAATTKPRPAFATPRAPVNATPVVCQLAAETGFAGTGVISSALVGASKSQQARACALEGIKVPAECNGLRYGCAKLDAASTTEVADIGVDVLPQILETPKELKKSPVAAAAKKAPSGPSVAHQASDALTAGGALDAALTGLEKRDLSGTTPEAFATACALANPRSHHLSGACRDSKPCSTDWVVEKRCLDLFRDGTSTFKHFSERDITDQMTNLWRDNHPGQRAKEEVVTDKDCCHILSSPCLCEMKKKIVGEGKVLGVECLKGLQGCT